jgi:hypothetical protein
MFDIVWYDYSDGDIESFITKAKQSSKTEYVWLAHRDLNYRKFNFRWMPNRHQLQYKHAWPSHNNSQHYTTWLIPVDNDSGTVHHDTMIPTIDTKYYDTCLLNTNSFENNIAIDFQVHLITTMQTAIDTAVKKSTKPWLWIIADCCEYEQFDFNWLPNNHEMNYIHCWPSGTCEKGDTFLINVDAYKRGERNYNFNHEPVQRKRWPNIKMTHDSLAQELNATPRLNSIYTVYSYTGFIGYPDVCLWENRPVVSLSRSNSTCLVPRDCIVKKEIYEYPYLMRETSYGIDLAIDVIFIDNGESCAKENFERCKKLEPLTKYCAGVNGRLAAYKKAANQSNSDWFIAVFAKCHVKDNFDDFDWQPDFWQEPKHYIFYNHNRNNNLTYGHMAPIAYNTKLLLQNTGGLDMTLAQMHTTVPICISETYIENDPWLTWRTAFREVIKLLHYSKENSSVENEYQLWSWKNVTKGKDFIWQQRGVKDAQDYYYVSGGDENLLMLTVEWDWLSAHFNNLYSDEITV